MYHTTNYLIFLLLGVALNAIAFSKQVQVPAVRDPEIFTAKLGTMSILPDLFQFKEIRKKSVSRQDNSRSNSFKPCKQNQPEVEFKIIDQISFEGVPKRPSVFYNFEQIQYSQYLLDVYYENLKIYIMFKNRRMAIVTMEDNQRINATKMIAIEVQDNNTFLQVGYFIKMDSALLFINGKFAFKITDSGASVLEGYVPIKQFQTATYIGDNHFAVLFQNQGVYIYKFDGVKISKQSSFSQKIITAGKSANLQDMVYWAQKETLFILDKFWGIRAFLVQDNQTNLSLKQTNLLNDMPQCNLMYLYESTLYVYCNQIRILNMNQWPKIVETVAPYPNVQVKEIYQLGSITAYVGRSSFAMVYYGRLVNFFEEKNLDKLLFFKDFYISAEEEGIKIGRITIIQPSITCLTNDDSQLGEAPLIINTTAQCSDQYFEKFNIDKKMLGNIGSDDVCVYPVHKTIKFWKVGQINPIPFIIGAILIQITLFGVGVIFLWRKKKIQSYNRIIQEYSRQQVSQSAKYQVMDDLDGKFSDNMKQSIKSDSEKKIKEQNEQKEQQKQQNQSNPSQVKLAEPDI